MKIENEQEQIKSEIESLDIIIKEQQALIDKNLDRYERAKNSILWSTSGLLKRKEAWDHSIMVMWHLNERRVELEALISPVGVPVGPHPEIRKIAARDLKILSDSDRLKFPIFILSAKDRLAVKTLIYYRDLCLNDKCESNFVRDVNIRISDIQTWQGDNIQYVKQPD